MRDQEFRAVERFLYREVRLLDERRFEEWLDLLADDLRYAMTMRSNRYPRESKAIAALDPDRYAGRNSEDEDDLAVFDETKDSLRGRIARLKTGMAWAEDPPSRTRHFLANIEIGPGDAAAELTVRANFIVYRSRGESEEDFYVGARRDALRRVDGGFLIARRRLVLDQNILSAKNISMFF
jgi:3-phenylpropionate/cinnamic acid dioxygenase small subunit